MFFFYTLMFSEKILQYDFTILVFNMGRTFMYGVSALGKKGGNHTISMLKQQLTQVM